MLRALAKNVAGRLSARIADLTAKAVFKTGHSLIATGYALSNTRLTGSLVSTQTLQKWDNTIRNRIIPHAVQSVLTSDSTNKFYGRVLLLGAAQYSDVIAPLVIKGMWSSSTPVGGAMVLTTIAKYAPWSLANHAGQLVRLLLDRPIPAIRQIIESLALHERDLADIFDPEIGSWIKSDGSTKNFPTYAILHLASTSRQVTRNIVSKLIEEARCNQGNDIPITLLPIFVERHSYAFDEHVPSLLHLMCDHPSEKLCGLLETLAKLQPEFFTTTNYPIILRMHAAMEGLYQGRATAIASGDLPDKKRISRWVRIHTSLCSLIEILKEKNPQLVAWHSQVKPTTKGKDILLN